MTKPPQALPHGVGQRGGVRATDAAPPSRSRDTLNRADRQSTMTNTPPVIFTHGDAQHA